MKLAQVMCFTIAAIHGILIVPALSAREPKAAIALGLMSAFWLSVHYILRWIEEPQR